MLLEGPPGTGKSTLLRAIARELGIGFEFVEGNAELDAGPAGRALRPGPGARRRVRRRRVRGRPARGSAPVRFVAVRRGAEPRARGDAQRAGLGDERARDHRAAARHARSRARLPSGGGDESVRRDRHRAHLVRDLRPRVPARRGLSGRSRRDGDHPSATNPTSTRPGSSRPSSWCGSPANTRMSASARRCVGRSTCVRWRASLGDVRSLPARDDRACRSTPRWSPCRAGSGFVRAASRNPEAIITELWQQVFESPANELDDPGKAPAPTGAKPAG